MDILQKEQQQINHGKKNIDTNRIINDESLLNRSQIEDINNNKYNSFESNKQRLIREQLRFQKQTVSKAYKRQFKTPPNYADVSIQNQSKMLSDRSTFLSSSNPNSSFKMMDIENYLQCNQ